MTIEQLPRYERLPGEYFVLRVSEDREEFKMQAGMLKSMGVQGRAFCTEGMTPYFNLHESGGFSGHRERRLGPGDCITFRRDESKPSGWSVITYAKADFEERYRRIEQPCT